MKFLFRSFLILLVLYGVVFAVGEAVLLRSGMPLWSHLLFATAIVAFQYLLSPFVIEWTLDIQWDDSRELLPVANREFLESLCARRGLPVPRIGVIHSGTPNAFTFGHVRSNARIVVTSGLLEVLEPQESNAVLAHELGHVEHRDFMVMAVAALAPLMLYQIYMVTERISNLRMAAYAAYLAYIVSQYIVLTLNRTREYFADHYAARVTQAPDLLSSALVKIAYGMVRQEGEYRRVMATGTREEKKYARREVQLGGSLALMGISNLRSGSALALGGANPRDAAAVMRWDLVNPWSRLYELRSTHPLTALRVRELNEQSAELHKPVGYPLPAERRIAWRGFPLEFLLWAAPLAGGFLLASMLFFPRGQAFAGIHFPPETRPYLLMFTGFAAIFRIAYRYRGRFEDASVGSLLEDTEVSEMRPRAVRLRGEIVGRGVPGAFWSPDLVLRDSTGMIFMLNRQTIPFARFFFAVVSAERFIGQEVEIEGWFRRGLRPYVEMSRLKGESGSGESSYSRWLQLGLAAAAMALGYWWLWSLRGF